MFQKLPRKYGGGGHKAASGFAWDIKKTVSVEIKFMDKIIIYCDGGSRGNPGPSALGIYITRN